MSQPDEKETEVKVEEGETVVVFMKKRKFYEIDCLGDASSQSETIAAIINERVEPQKRLKANDEADPPKNVTTILSYFEISRELKRVNTTSCSSAIIVSEKVNDL